MAKFFDLVRVTVAVAPGTGTITLGPAVNGYLTFPAGGVTNGTVVTYAINDGAQSEVGHGTYTTVSNTLTRTTILASTSGGIGGAAINASINAQVFITLAAEDFNYNSLSGTSLTLNGATSGSQVWQPAAIASGTITFPAGTTNFSATGGASQVVKQTSVGAPFTVAQLTYSDISGTVPLPGTTVPISDGGTGQTTQAAAFDALSPTTTQGDLVVRGASSNGRLGIGTANQALFSNGTTATWASFQQSGTGAVFRDWFSKTRDIINVLDFGADPTNVSPSSTPIQNAINYAASLGGGGAMVWVPQGTYDVTSGIVLPGSVYLMGSGQNNTFLQSWHVDHTPVTMNGNYGSIQNLTIYGKGVNNDTGVFGAAASNALVINGVANYIANVTAWGGVAAIQITGTDCYLENVFPSESYGNTIVANTGANWFIRCKIDHSPTAQGITTAQPYPAWAATTAYVAGNAVITGGYTIVCTVAGTSGGSAPTLKNYGINIPDGAGSLVWQLVGNSNLSGMLLSSNTCGENHCTQTDFTGTGYVQSVVFQPSATPTNGPPVICLDGCVLAAGAVMQGGTNVAWFSAINCEVAGTVTLNASYAGAFTYSNNNSVGSASNVTVGVAVSNMSITDNILWGGTITVLNGASDHYVIANNIRVTVSDSGTGTHKTVSGNVA